MKTQNIDINKIKPYSRNAKKHPDEQLKALAAIVAEVGWRQNVLVNQKGVIIVGHGRFEAWQKYKDEYGLKDIWIKDDKGNDVFGEVETTPMTATQEKIYRLADNKLAESETDIELVLEELGEMTVEEVKLTGFDMDVLADECLEEDIYTRKIEAPVYEPSDIPQEISELFDDSKYVHLRDLINGLNLDNDISSFLLIGATRFIRFDYKAIADYYAGTSSEIQDVFEKLALVIVDYDNAIKNGFIKMSKNILKYNE